MSAQQTSKLSLELNDFRQRYDVSNQESETYKQRIQKLLSENTGLNEEVRSAQENLRLSAGQMGKLQNEFKIACNEIEELKRRINDLMNANKKIGEYESKIALLSQ